MHMFDHQTYNYVVDVDTLHAGLNPQKMLQEHQELSELNKRQLNQVIQVCTKELLPFGS